MNKDFHFYGTFNAALEAGFSKGEADIIAHAAQMVDEFDESKAETGEYIATVQNLSDNVRDMWNAKTNVEEEDIRRIRSIWMPFHFLPGDFGQAVSNGNNDPQFSLDDISHDVRNMNEFQTICHHNSRLVQMMIEKGREKKVKHWELGGSEKDKVLYNIGVRMHVLADTWAHEFFSGTPSKTVNNARDFKVIEGNCSILSDLIGTPEIENEYSINYLGHGRAGHYPDLGCLIYEYHPAWMRENGKIIRNNPYNFMCAYAQMVQAMKYIMNGPTGNFVLQPDKNLYDDFNTLAYHDKIEAVIRTEKDDQCGAWKEFTMKVRNVQVPEYDKSKVDVCLFQKAAKSHKKMVCDELRNLYGNNFI